jgi:hypothetical protein
MRRRSFLVLAGATLMAVVGGRAAAHHKPGHQHGPTTTTGEPVPTYITAPTTTVIDPSGLENRLEWAPPPLTSPTTIEVGEGSALGPEPAQINLTAGQDYIIDWVGKTTKRVRINGGRHVVIVGAEVDINSAHASLDDRNALWFDAQTGIIHIEGLWAHGSFINDGVKGVAGSAVWQVQASRIDELQGTQAGYHCDGFQPFGGFTELRIDLVTVYSQFQALMMKADANHWLTTSIRRLNVGQYLTPDTTARSFNLIGGGNNPDGFLFMEGPVHFGDQCYLQPRTTSITSSIAPAAWFTISGTGADEVATPNPAGWVGTNPDLVMDGVIKEGLPPGGDYVPAPSSGGNVGLNYVSPGYRNG